MSSKKTRLFAAAVTISIVLSVFASALVQAPGRPPSNRFVVCTNGEHAVNEAARKGV